MFAVRGPVFAVRGPVFEAIGHAARLRAFGNGIPRNSRGMRYVVYVHGPVRFAVRSRAAALPVALLYSPIKKPAYSGLVCGLGAGLESEADLNHAIRAKEALAVNVVEI